MAALCLVCAFFLALEGSRHWFCFLVLALLVK